jgi:hypothetical protein
VNANGNDVCDTSFMSGSVWYRFLGESGTQIPTSPTSPTQCGTQVTGWYAGAMPAVSETITNGRVCFSFQNNNCQWSNTISVTNCRSFYIYQLILPPVCPARYCTHTPNISIITVSPSKIFKGESLSYHSFPLVIEILDVNRFHCPKFINYRRTFRNRMVKDIHVWKIIFKFDVVTLFKTES